MYEYKVNVFKGEKNDFDSNITYFYLKKENIFSKIFNPFGSAVLLILSGSLNTPPLSLKIN